MGSKTQTVGGGSATGVANDFNGWLKQGLNNGQFGAQGQTSGIGSTIDSLLKGRTGDPTGLNDYQSTLKQMQDSGRYTPDAITGHGSANPLDDPNHPFNQIMGQLQGQNLMQGFGGQANLGGPFHAQGGDIGNIMSQVGSRAQLGSLDGFTGGLQGAAQQLGNAAAGNFFTRTPSDVNSAYGSAVQQLLQQKSARDIADLRARYAITGGSQGTPAATAEALYRSEAIPQMTAALSNINNQEQGLDLQAAGVNSQMSLGQSGQGIQALLGAGNLAGTGRGQDLENFLGNRQADIGAGGLSVSNAANINNANLQARGQDLQNFLSSRGMDIQQLGLANSSLLGQAGLGFQAGQAGMQNNQFNSNLDFNSQNANANNNLQAQNLWQQMMNNTGQLALGGGQLQLQNSNSNTQNQQNAFNSIMQMFGQSNQLGTPQAQTVQTPGFLSQLGSAANGIGNLFNAGSNIMGAFNRPQGGIPQGIPQQGFTPQGYNPGGYGNYGYPMPTTRLG